MIKGFLVMCLMSVTGTCVVYFLHLPTFLIFILSFLSGITGHLISKGK